MFAGMVGHVGWVKAHLTKVLLLMIEPNTFLISSKKQGLRTN